MEEWGRLDVVVANARINGTWAGIEDLTVDDFRSTLDINLVGTFTTIKYAVPQLKRRGGSVVITASVNGTRIFSNSGATAYSSSKAGQVALAKMLAVELGPNRIRVNVICPGAISTEIADNTTAVNDDVKIPVDYPEGNIPLTGGQPGSADQSGDLIAFLATDGASHTSAAPRPGSMVPSPCSKAGSPCAHSPFRSEEPSRQLDPVLPHGNVGAVVGSRPPHSSVRAPGGPATVTSLAARRHPDTRSGTGASCDQSLKASLTFSPACFRLPEAWSPRPSACSCSLSVASPMLSLALPLSSSALFSTLSSVPIARSFAIATTTGLSSLWRMSRIPTIGCIQSAVA